jgi:GNAT acetyltransferase-like protein
MADREKTSPQRPPAASARREGGLAALAIAGAQEGAAGSSRPSPACLSMMTFRTLDASRPDDLAEWIRLWQSWPAREVMGHPEYARLFARPCDRVVCAAGEDEGGAILFPLLLRPLAAEPWAREGESRFDAITPYGYGGPFAWGAGARDDAAYWRAHAAWCRDERIVSTFARLSLFEGQLASLPRPAEVRQPNVVVPLSEGAEALWNGYETKVRGWVRHAQEAGLRVEVDEEGARVDAFASVYTHTMERRGADAWYFFPRAFFQAIVRNLPGQYAFFCTLRGDEVVSSDLVLCSEENVYYFLGGTRADAFEDGPNYLLKHAVAGWAMTRGKKRYVLGGGYEPKDGLYRYKRAYARRGEVPFRVASLVHDEAALAELATDRAAFAAARGEPWAPRAGFFPPYRA